jgi:monoterpene epsilon-lactone hydrolase
MNYKHVMLYYKVMRKIRALTDLEPLHIRWYLEKLAILNRPAKGTVVEEKKLSGVRCELTRLENSSDDLILFVIHGGAFAFGSPRTHRNFIAHLCRLVGSIAIAPDYGLAPEHYYPQPIDDCHKAYLALKEEFPKSKIWVVGDSAGGNLAAALTYRLNVRKEPLIDGLVLLSPWLDLREDSKAAKANNDKDSVFNRDDLIRFGQMYMPETLRDDPEVSPAMIKDSSFFPPTIIQATRNELLYHDSAQFHKKLKRAGVDVKFEEEQHLFHSWQLFPDYLKEAKASLKNIADFIQERN